MDKVTRFYFKVMADTPTKWGRVFYFHFDKSKLSPMTESFIKEQAYCALKAFGFSYGSIRIDSIKKVRSIPAGFATIRNCTWIYV